MKALAVLRCAYSEVSSVSSQTTVARQAPERPLQEHLTAIQLQICEVLVTILSEYVQEERSKRIAWEQKSRTEQVRYWVGYHWLW